VELYSESVRKRQVNPKKFYLIDLGLHNYLTFKFSETKGRLLENLVYLGLRRRGYPIYYYKTARGQEVDFLIKENKRWHLIQVCHDSSQIDTFSREKKALLSGLRELKINTGMILTDSHKQVERVGGKTLRVVPVLGVAVKLVLTFLICSIIQTYIERDVSGISNVGNQSTFQRFMKPCSDESLLVLIY
jgi:predicted AAA+ superfamily ATPase